MIRKALCSFMLLLLLLACSANLPTSPESQDVPNLTRDIDNSAQNGEGDPLPPLPVMRTPIRIVFSILIHLHDSITNRKMGQGLV